MGGAWRACRARASWAGALIALLAAGGCARGALVETADGFRHRRHDYEVGLPPDHAPPWRRVEVEGSVLAYERPGPIRMTLSSRCRVPITRPDILARHLRIGIPALTLREQGPVEDGLLPGWQQVFDVVERDVVVRVKTVTFVADPCVLDWTLTARDGRGFEAAERDFDAWWHTLRVAAPARPPAAAAAKPPAADTASPATAGDAP